MQSNTTLKGWILAQVLSSYVVLNQDFHGRKKWPCCWCKNWLVACQEVGYWLRVFLLLGKT